MRFQLETWLAQYEAGIRARRRRQGKQTIPQAVAAKRRRKAKQEEG